MAIENKKKILILGAGALQLPAILESSRMGLETIVVDYDANAVGAKYADTFYNVSTLDTKAVLEVAEKEHVSGIITICTDRPVNVVAKVGSKLGLNTISEQTALKATDKCAMRDALRDGNVPIPKYKKVKTFDEYLAALDEIGYPCICKPADNSGSRGVNYIESANAAHEKIFQTAQENSINGSVLLEEYMVGPEVSVEVMAENGCIEVIQITDKITTGSPHFVEMGHTQPSRLPKETELAIIGVSKAAIVAINLKNGPAHVEVIVTKDGPKIVELGARLGGDYITTHLVPLSTGYNMVRANILIAMGMKNTEKVLYDNAAAIRYFNNDKPIRLERDTLDMLEEFYVSFENHQELESSLDRTGFFIVKDDNLESLDEKINEVKKCL